MISQNHMNKVGVTLLILATLGLGYWLSVGNNSVKNPETKNINLFSDSTAQKQQAQDQTQKTVSETKDQIINKQIDNKKIMTAILHTNKGGITIEFNSATPKTVENFISLAKSGFYDGTKFHRIIKGFMSQGGDPLSKDDSKKDFWGTGGPGYKFDDELSSSNSNDINTIAMANSGPNTNGSQFFINAAVNHFLDTKHVVFGKVTVGQDVALAINSVPTGPNDRPIDPVILKSITLK